MGNSVLKGDPINRSWRNKVKRIVCGIDSGTSNTAVAIAGGAEKAVHLVPVEGEHQTIPSTLFFPQNAQSTLFGRQALTAYIAGEEGRFMRSLKRVLGTSLMEEGTDVAGQRKRFADMIGSFIAALKERAEQQTKTTLESVVAGRPVHFVDGNDKADRDAENQLAAIFQTVGFKNIHFQYEPIAAAFAHEAELDDQERLAMVIDIGGGTSDFTIIRLSGRYITKMDRQDDILANAGVRVGGNDFDHGLSMQCFMPLLGLGSLWSAKNLAVPVAPFADLSEWSKIHFMYAPKYKRDLARMAAEAQDREKIDRLLTVVEEELGHKLMGVIEETKIALSSGTQTAANLSFITKELAAQITRDQFEASLQRSIKTIETAIAECTTLAKVKPTDIELVILTGGGTSIPKIQQLIRTTFPQATLSEGNRLSSVGLGLAYDARRRYLG